MIRLLWIRSGVLECFTGRVSQPFQGCAVRFPNRFVMVLLVSGPCLIAGCSHTPTAPKTTLPAPSPPATPLAVATYLRDCWRERSISGYELLPTEDFRFEFASGDSAGTYYSGTPWTRGDELATAEHLFVSGTASQPPVSSIAIDFTSPPTDSADPRPGMNPRWHRLVTMAASIRFYFADGGFEITGPSQFFVVRGDSAEIPADMIAAGVKPDTTRWWLERWTDETFHAYSAVPARSGSPSARALATKSSSWGSIKALYR